ncbi:Gldg family protein, partial [bacterium]|nr:Gldg family protein [bacterium]
RNEIPDAELFAIDQYVMNGGKAAFLIDRNDVNMQTFIGRPIATGLADLAAHYGARVTQPLVLDEQNQQVGLTRMQGNVRFQSFVRFPVFVRVTDLAADSPLTRNLQDLTLPFTTPIELSAPEGVTANVIAKSSERTWLFENDDSYLVEPQLLPQPEEGDFVGPRPLVATLEGSLPSFFADKAIPAHGSGDPVAATKLDASPETRVAVVAGSYFAADELRNSLGYVFFANLVDWLGANERLIGIRTKTIINRPLNVPGDAARNAVRYGNMFVPPLALIAFGIARWRWRARKKRKGAAILDDLPKAA